jgi:hypothetical protein
MTDLTINNLQSNIPNQEFHTIAELHNGYKLHFGSFMVSLETKPFRFDTINTSQNEKNQLEHLCLAIWSYRGTDLAKKLYLALIVEVDKLFKTQLQQEVIDHL